jgi:GNAT superfamily N-acetyltransferase
MLATRDAAEADYPLIADSFYRVARSIPACYGAGRPFLIAMLDKVIADPTWTVTVLHESDVPDETIGWAIHRSTNELFFIAIKPRYQRLGMGRHLLTAIGVLPYANTHVPFVPPKLVAVAGKHHYNMIPRPYMALHG